MFFLGFLLESSVFLFAYIYPIHRSIKAYKLSPNRFDTRIMKWLKYWIILSFVVVLEFFFKNILLKFVPFYALIRVIFYISGPFGCFEYIYDAAIGPLIHDNHDTIDSSLQTVNLHKIFLVAHIRFRIFDAIRERSEFFSDGLSDKSCEKFAELEYGSKGEKIRRVDWKECKWNSAAAE